MHEAWRTIPLDFIKNNIRKSGSLEAKYEKMRGGLRLLLSTVYKVNVNIKNVIQPQTSCCMRLVCANQSQNKLSSTSSGTCNVNSIMAKSYVVSSFSKFHQLFSIDS